MNNESSASAVGLNKPDQRLRTDGILSQTDLEWCLANEVPVGYDCVQSGWVPLNVQNNLPHMEPGESQSNELHEFVVTSRAHLRALISEKTAGRAAGSEEPEAEISSFIKEKIKEICRSVSSAKGDVNHINKLHIALWAEAIPYLPVPKSPIGGSRVFNYRQWQQHDAQRYYEIFSSDKVWLHLPEQRPLNFTAEIAKHMIEAANIGAHHHTCAVLLDQEIIGQIRLLFDETSAGLRGAEVAYLLGEQWWGQGLMTDILGDFTQRSFEEHKLQYIYAWIERGHSASIRCCERAGYVRDDFEQESVLAEQQNRQGFIRYIKFCQ